jgi:hypothetical protein
MENIEQYIQEHVALISLDNKGLAQASARATQFLVVQAVIASEIKTLKEALTQVDTIKSVRYSMAINAADGKNITEKKTQAECDSGYTDVKESFDTIEANISYLKTHLEIFNNAHVMYRQLAKE